ncbi:hypothetical protein, partial [Burkholderia cenocepacia]|uniref:hypothetical protein n=1 Tax=Burkholderia cenocepacia TaxID=95486 RepID=UPI001C4DFAC7
MNDYKFETRCRRFKREQARAILGSDSMILMPLRYRPSACVEIAAPTGNSYMRPLRNRPSTTPPSFLRYWRLLRFCFHPLP